jgi:hypothetical protein
LAGWHDDELARVLDVAVAGGRGSEIGYETDSLSHDKVAPVIQFTTSRYLPVKAGHAAADYEYPFCNFAY